MASNRDKSNLVMSADEQKILLLHTVSKKVMEMARDLPGLDILDFNVNKTSKKVTLSVGFKETKPQKQLDLTEVIELDPMETRNNKPTYRTFQPASQCEIHGKECPFSKTQDTEHLETEKSKHRVPLTDRPEFREQLISPGVQMMQKEIVRIITDYTKNDSTTDRDNTSDEEDDTPTWFDNFVNTNVEDMDTKYFHSLLNQRAADPGNSAIQKRIDKYLSEHCSNDTDMDDDYKEFVPGEVWLSRAQRRLDLDTTMNGIEDAISRHKTNACLLVSDILQKAEAFEKEGRNLAKEIQKAIKGDEKTDRRRNTGILEEAVKKMESNVEEKKKTRFEDVIKKEALKSEGLKIGSFGSSLFRT